MGDMSEVGDGMSEVGDGLADIGRTESTAKKYISYVIGAIAILCAILIVLDVIPVETEKWNLVGLLVGVGAVVPLAGWYSAKLAHESKAWAEMDGGVVAAQGLGMAVRAF